MKHIDGVIVTLVRPEYPSITGREPAYRRRYLFGPDKKAGWQTTGEPDDAMQFVTQADADKAIMRYIEAQGAAGAGHDLQKLTFIPEHDDEIPSRPQPVPYDGRAAPQPRKFKRAFADAATI